MATPTTCWLFGYGSLIWRPDFSFHRRVPAILNGYARRFWQGSHDHRGTPDTPGRVVTLIEAPDQRCVGMAYEIDASTAATILVSLDHREKNGYERSEVTLRLETGRQVPALLYRAMAGNFAWLGDAPSETLAAQIAHSSGPSGRNDDYLFELERSLADLGAVDSHVSDLARAVRTIQRASQENAAGKRAAS